MGRSTLAKVVLIVEDHAPTRETLCALLAHAGMECIATGTVADALARLKKVHPACVLLDLVLPDGAGLDVLLAIRRAGLRSRVIVSTATTDPDLINAAYALEPDIFLQKPHGASLLLRFVREAMDAADDA